MFLYGWRKWVFGTAHGRLARSYRLDAFDYDIDPWTCIIVGRAKEMTVAMNKGCKRKEMAKRGGPNVLGGMK